MGDFLTEAVAESRERVARWRANHFFDRMAAISHSEFPNVSFADALRGPASLKIIAEIKRASPSRGSIRDDISPEKQAEAYVRGGATAISVLTESRWFQGAVEDLMAVRATANVPLLRKDFMVEDEDIVLSHLIGANAVLLIVASVSLSRLRELIQHARNRGMCPLVEVHDCAELEAAIEAGADVIGVNARNLRTLEVNAANALDVIRHVPSTCIRIFESGIKSTLDVQAAMQAGADAILVGESLVRSADPAALIQSWLKAAEFVTQENETT